MKWSLSISQEDVPQGVALDIFQTAPFFEFDTRVTGSNDPAAMQDADVVVVTAGCPVNPGCRVPMCSTSTSRSLTRLSAIS